MSPYTFYGWLPFKFNHSLTQSLSLALRLVVAATVEVVSSFVVVVVGFLVIVLGLIKEGVDI